MELISEQNKGKTENYGIKSDPRTECSGIFLLFLVREKAEGFAGGEDQGAQHQISDAVSQVEGDAVCDVDSKAFPRQIHQEGLGKGPQSAV